MHDICLGKSNEPFGSFAKKSCMKNEAEKAKWMNERIEKGYSFRYCKNSDRLNVSVLCVETKEEFFFDWEDDVLKSAKNNTQQQLYDANAQSAKADCVAKGEKMERATFEIAKNIRRIIVTSAAESMNYLNWSADFVASQIREIPERLKKADWFVPINPADLTEAEMRELGFCKWSEEDPMFLIPLWLFPFLPDEVDCGCISGEKRIQKKSEMNNDHRFGCLAYGVMPKKEA